MLAGQSSPNRAKFAGILLHPSYLTRTMHKEQSEDEPLSPEINISAWKSDRADSLKAVDACLKTTERGLRRQVSTADADSELESGHWAI
jgi:hypothetical protein